MGCIADLREHVLLGEWFLFMVDLFIELVHGFINRLLIGGPHLTMALALLMG